MLLTVDQDKAAFAMLDGQLQKNFEEALEQLRRIYASHATEWAKFELNLVLCQSTDVPHTFHTKIEVDPYFCRKFIIDPKQLDTELKRLPFIPLSILKQISERPVSAQSFLVQHGVPSELARYTVIPHAKGNKRIIEECLRGDWGTPEKREHPGEQFVGPTTADTSVQIRLKSLEICGFRAYRKKLDFDLDADIVVLFGPNGFGKTSFFDAIDFACTGSVARFDERFGRDVQRLMMSLKNLDSSLQDCYVAATLSIDGKEISIKRYLESRAKVTLDDDTEPRKQALLKIAGLSEKASDIRVENLIRLFRATHLFGQEYQSLTCDFRKESTLSEDIVSRMLALQDYVQGIDKTSQITTDLRRQIQEKKTRIASMEKDLVSKQIQIHDLQKLRNSIEQPQAVTQMGKEIAIRVVKAGIDIGDSTLDEKTARGWRSLVGAKIASLERRASIVNEILRKYPEYLDCKEKLAETLASLSKVTTSLDDVNKRIKEVQVKWGSADAQIEKKLDEEKTILSEKDNLDWFLAVRLKYIASTDGAKKQSLLYNDVNDKLTTVSSRLAFLESQREPLLDAIKDKRTQIDDFRKNVDDLDRLCAEIENWQSWVDQEKLAVSELQVLDGQLAGLEREMSLKQQEFLTAEKYYTELGSHLAGMQALESELQQLLLGLEDHIVNNICPACGASYASKDELIEKLHKCRGSDSEELSKLRQAHGEAKLKYEQLRAVTLDMQNRIQDSTQKHDKTVQELDELHDKISQYEERLLAFGIQATTRDVEVSVNTERKRALDAISTSQRELENLLSQAGLNESELSGLKDKQVGLLATMHEISARQESLKGQVATITQEALDRRVSMTMTKGAAAKRLTKIAQLIQANQKELQAARAEADRVKEELNLLETKKHNLQKEVDGLSNVRDSQTECVDDVKRLTIEIGLSEVDANRIQEIYSQVSQQVRELNVLHDDLSNLEMALNNAEMSGTSARIAKEKSDLEQITKSEKQILRELDDWCVYFQTIREELEQLRSQALEKHIESYGPLSSSIQKRLRSVYGFGDVNLRVHKGTIIAEVERSGHIGLSPSDYFSESQIQIAMLSLFLSANLTQNWSRFCPILLDDPVEHFDDLNSYALVGLIKRLASRRRYGRQFIVSTCDERLYRLMRQQFNTIDGKVAYYKFAALGETGPTIELT